MNSTVFFIFVLPFLIGMVIRLIFRKWQKGYIVSCILVLCSVVAWLWTNHLTNHGVDGTVMLWALMAIELTVGWIGVGGALLLSRKMKH